MAYLCKIQFPIIRTKLHNRNYGQFCVSRKINDNTYVLQLSEDWNISKTFKVTKLFKFHADELLYPYNKSGVSFFSSAGE